MADGFLGRWAKRKEAVRRGEELPPEPERKVEAKAVVPPLRPSPGEGGNVQEFPPAVGEGQGGASTAPPPPTLEEVQSLSADADFTRFVRPDVAPEVKNAALKKLFADPHFNVMDGLDVYIDDYSKPDPLPASMLRQLASAKFLNLFEDEEKKQAHPAQSPAAGEVADVPGAETVAQSDTRTGPALPPAEHHADPDLRLQQDDAPGPEGPGAGPR